MNSLEKYLALKNQMYDSLRKYLRFKHVLYK